MPAGILTTLTYVNRQVVMYQAIRTSFLPSHCTEMKYARDIFQPHNLLDLDMNRTVHGTCQQGGREQALR
jgi:hypothetical protein